MNPAVTGQRLLVICPERNRKHKRNKCTQPQIILSDLPQRTVLQPFFATEFFRIFTLTADQNTVSSSKPRDRLLSVFFGLLFL